MTREMIEQAAVEYRNDLLSDAALEVNYEEDNHDAGYRDCIVEKIHEAFAAGADFVLSHQWVSVEDRLPEPEQEVLLYNNHSIRRYEIGWLRKKKGDSKSRWALSNGFVEDNDITHWCAIPELNNKKE